jgi:hypothetical protein
VDDVDDDDDDDDDTLYLRDVRNSKARLKSVEFFFTTRLDGLEIIDLCPDACEAVTFTSWLDLIMSA